MYSFASATNSAVHHCLLSFLNIEYSFHTCVHAFDSCLLRRKDRSGSSHKRFQTPSSTISQFCRFFFVEMMSICCQLVVFFTLSFGQFELHLGLTYDASLLLSSGMCYLFLWTSTDRLSCMYCIRVSHNTVSWHNTHVLSRTIVCSYPTCSKFGRSWPFNTGVISQ